jgi:hypothetical protein
MPLAMRATCHMPFGVLQVSQVHVSPLKLPDFSAFSIINLHYRPLAFMRSLEEKHTTNGRLQGDRWTTNKFALQCSALAAVWSQQRARGEQERKDNIGQAKATESVEKSQSTTQSTTHPLQHSIKEGWSSNWLWL